MALSERQRARLCHGRIVHAMVPKSKGTGSAGPHCGIILDTDEQIQEDDSLLNLVVISHGFKNSQNKTNQKYRLRPPPGYSGFIWCDYVVAVPINQIDDVKDDVISEPKMIEIITKIRLARSEKSTRS